jgi:hypothetical protein
MRSNQELKAALERYGVKLRQASKLPGKPRGYFREDIRAAAQAKI